jgi:hypothetical protein
MAELIRRGSGPSAVAAIASLLLVTACGGGDSSSRAVEEAAGEASPAQAEQAAATEQPTATGRVAPSAAASDFQVADTLQSLRGILTFGYEVDVFRVCGGNEESWVRDGTGGGLERGMEGAGVGEYQPFYAVIRGTVQPPFTAGPGASFGSRIELAELLEISADTTLCSGAE